MKRSVFTLLYTLRYAPLGGVALVRVNPSDEVAGLFRFDDEGAIKISEKGDDDTAGDAAGQADAALHAAEGGWSQSPLAVPCNPLGGWCPEVSQPPRGLPHPASLRA